VTVVLGVDQRKFFSLYVHITFKMQPKLAIWQAVRLADGISLVELARGLEQDGRRCDWSLILPPSEQAAGLL